MAGTVKFDLVSPERRLVAMEAVEVQIPGAQGDLTAMEGHAPTITTLRPGVLRAVSAGSQAAFAVTGGFAEITAGSVSVLAERAIPMAEVTGALLDSLIAEARERAATAGEGRDAADLYVGDLVALRTGAAV
jgi:F-type H+-transporting ATPase subunit epsilon